MALKDLLGRGRRRPSDREIDRELQDHLDLEAEARDHDDAHPTAARRAARLVFGNPALVKEDVRAVPRRAWWEHLVQDTSYALRTFRRSPVFTATAILTLALGIGANTAMFTIVNATFGRSLPVARPGTLALITTPDDFSYPTYRTLAQGTRSLTHLLAASSTNRFGVEIGDDGSQAAIKIVSGNYFESLGVPASAGRVFNAAEEAEPVAVISHGFWLTRLGGAANAAGRLVRIGGLPFTIVGVAPPRFFGESAGEAPDLFVTMAFQPIGMRNERGFTWLRLLGRLAPGVTLTQAQAELAGLAPDVPIAVAAGERGTPGLRQRFAAPLTVMVVMVGVVLVIACTNLASLLLTRGAARRQEIAIRLALGSSRGRIVRQLMTENVLIAALGGAFGLLLSFWGTRVLVGLAAAAGETLALELSPDLRVLLFAGFVSLVTSVLFGLAPALRAAGRRAADSLLDRGHAIVGTERRWNLRGAFLILQMALSLLLVAAGAMFVRTVINLQAQDLGSRAEHLVLATLMADRAYRPDVAVVLPRLLERVRALPGVESASAASFGTLANQGGIYGIAVDGFTPVGQQDTRARADYVAPDYFRTAGMALVAGREFTWADRPGSAPVAIVNQTMARFYFGTEEVTGRRFRFNKIEYEIVGVARDANYGDLRETTPPRYVYFAALQRSGGAGTLEIRTAANGAMTAAALHGLVRDVDPRLSVGGVMTMADRIGLKVGRERMVASLAGFFGGLTLLLACVGIYGTLAYHAARRSKDIALRLALGATPISVVWLVVRQVVVQLSAGLLLGSAALLASGQLVRSILYGVEPTDPLTIAVPAGLLVGIALLAASIPAIRAARLDPAQILRE
jgi:predicted permease